MADVQLEHGYLRLANRLATAIALAPWGSPSHPRIVMALIRATYGLRRREAPIGAADWRAFTGLSDRHIRRAKLELADAGVIVLVADFDARTHAPQTWMLQKNFTKWGMYSVSESDVEAAEQAFTVGITQGSQSAPPDTDGRGAPRTQMCGDQGTRMDGDQGTQIVGGTGSNHANDNNLQRRKTVKTGKTDKKKTSSSKKSTRLPDDWTPNEQHSEIARELGLNVGLEATKMRDWALAGGKTGVDWDARFRNWLRNATATPNGQKQRIPQQQQPYTPSTRFAGFQR